MRSKSGVDETELVITEKEEERESLNSASIWDISLYTQDMCFQTDLVVFDFKSNIIEGSKAF